MRLVAFGLLLGALFCTVDLNFCSASGQSDNNIVVTGAIYGFNCGAPVDCSAKIRSHCKGKHKCTYSFNFEKDCGFDPKESCTKDLSVNYQCGFGRVQTVHFEGEAGWNTQVNLICDEAERVRSFALSSYPSFAGAVVTKTEVIGSGWDDLYSPEVHGSLMYFGGWHTAAERLGPDKIYISGFNGKGWGEPQPLRWTNLEVPGIVPGHIINDPSIIYRPDVGWHFMYFTSLANKYIVKDHITRHNFVNLATSTDGGLSWHHHGVIIGQNNGFDNTGAWSPSALHAGNEIWLYYHTGSANCTSEACEDPDDQPPRVLRSRLSLNGWQRIGTEELINQNGGKVELTNPDVKFAHGRYWMVGNDGGATSIYLLISDDGIQFYPYDGQEGLLINGNGQLLATPHITVTGPSSFEVYFGYGPNIMNFHSVHRWSYELY